MEELTKEDWRKIRDDGNKLLKEALISAAVFRNTVWAAEAQLKKFTDDGKNKKLGEHETKKAMDYALASKAGGR